MKNILKTIAVLAAVLSLSACDQEIKNVQVKDLIGTWDLVSEEVSYPDGSTVSTPGKGQYIVITETIYTSYDKKGREERSCSFTYTNSHLMLDGVSEYDVVSLKKKEMVLKQNLFQILTTDHKYNYKRR